MKKVAFHNLGCKVNSYEMDGIMQMFQKRDYEIVDFAQKADIYVINTCSVTNIADRKSRQMIHKAKAQNPDSITVAVGCYVQADAKRAADDESIDIAIGNNVKNDIVDIVESYIESGNEVNCHCTDLSVRQPYEEFMLESSMEHTRAFIKIQDGCNQFCSYCIIPYTRGRVRSREAESILNEIRGLVQRGYREFVLTGIHLSSYGLDDDVYNRFAGDDATNEKLLEVIRRVALIDGVDRIRLGSLEPRLITADFLKAIAAISKVCPHFHISLQSGSDSVLKRMNRQYSADDFAKRVGLIREYYEHPAIATDVIVGFAGETMEEFNETRAFLEKIKLYETHIFKFSRRKGTVADKMEGQLTEKEKTARSEILIAEQIPRRDEFLSYAVGRSLEVLTEEIKEIDGKQYLVGYTQDYMRCAIRIADGSDIGPNVLVRVRGESVKDGYILCFIEE